MRGSPSGFRHIGLFTVLAALSLMLTGQAMGASTPSETDIKPLVTNALLDFNDAIQKKDFTAFRANASRFLADKLSAADMLKAFDDFVKKDVNIEGIKDLPAEFDKPPAVDENGVLLVVGLYSTTPYKVLFTLKFISELQGGKDQWKVVGLSVDVKKIAAPAEPELRKLVTTSLLDFSAGVKGKDFKPFLANCSKAFQDQFTSEKLMDAFKDFVVKEVDISIIKGINPVFDKPPAFGEDKENADSAWVLSADGHFPTPDVHVYFSLRYLPEGNGWKIISIDVNTRKPE